MGEYLSVEEKVAQEKVAQEKVVQEKVVQEKVAQEKVVQEKVVEARKKEIAKALNNEMPNRLRGRPTPGLFTEVYLKEQEEANKVSRAEQEECNCVKCNDPRKNMWGSKNEKGFLKSDGYLIDWDGEAGFRG